MLNSNRKIWVVTDIDGTLMDHQYDLSPALGTLNKLKQLGIPVIPCTSKTAAEVRSLRRQIESKDPYIVENGGAIYGNKASSNDEWEFVLGRSFKYLRPLLDVLSESLGYQLKALNDLSYEEIESLTGLNDEGISLALDRQWSVPFLNPAESDTEKLAHLAEKIGTTIYKGNRMSHLLSKGSHKGRAVLELKKFLDEPNAMVIALGDSHNDLPLLEIADKAIVVPSKDGPNQFLVEGIKAGKFDLAPQPHAYGWSLAIEKIINVN